MGTKEYLKPDVGANTITQWVYAQRVAFKSGRCPSINFWGRRSPISGRKTRTSGHCPEYESIGAYEDDSEPEIPLIPAILPPALSPALPEVAVDFSDVEWPYFFQFGSKPEDFTIDLNHLVLQKEEFAGFQNAMKGKRSFEQGLADAMLPGQSAPKRSWGSWRTTFQNEFRYCGMRYQKAQAPQPLHGPRKLGYEPVIWLSHRWPCSSGCSS